MEWKDFFCKWHNEKIGYAAVIIEDGMLEQRFYLDDNPAMKKRYDGLPICSKKNKEMSKNWTGGPCRYREY